MNFYSNIPKKTKVNQRPFLYLGRITKWKGFDKFCEFIEKEYSTRPVFVFTTPAIHLDVFDGRFFSKEGRHLVFSESIASFEWNDLAIHLYPSFYAENVLHPMSISFNVLECIYLGIPSLISQEKFESWPEFEGSILCLTTTWNEEELRTLVSELIETPRNQFLEESAKFKELINIEGHCERMWEN
jgi:glycosyltransferase involved in cell wall biosynthesis